MSPTWLSKLKAFKGGLKRQAQKGIKQIGKINRRDQELARVLKSR